MLSDKQVKLIKETVGKQMRRYDIASAKLNNHYDDLKEALYQLSFYPELLDRVRDENKRLRAELEERNNTISKLQEILNSDGIL